MNAVWRQSRASGRQKLVLLAIADHQGELGAWPSIATLAKMVNASERSVQRDIQELAAMGELLIEEQAAPTRGQYKTNRYWVTVSGVTDSKPGVTDSAIRGDTVVVQNLIEPLEEPLYAQGELERAFDEFWKVYPRKVGKQAARKAFAKVKVDLERVLQGARRFANDPNKPILQYLPHPSTWLNEGRWDDEPYPEREKSKEERQQEALEKYHRDRQAALEASRRLREEMEEAKRRAEENPPEWCEHDRIKLVCKKCQTQQVA